MPFGFRASNSTSNDNSVTSLASGALVVTQGDLVACFLKHEGAATTLSRELHERLGPRGRFLITEVTDNTYGWLPKDTWYLLKNKRLRPKPTDKKQLS